MLLPKKLSEENVVEKEYLARNLQENWEENAGDLNIKKLFNKCILINKWKNYGPQTRPAGPPAAARSRLLGVGSPPRTRADELTPFL